MRLIMHLTKKPFGTNGCEWAHPLQLGYAFAPPVTQSGCVALVVSLSLALSLSLSFFFYYFVFLLD